MECFRLLFDHFAWIGRLFLSSIKDSRKVGQIKNFMDKDRRVSIETISAQFDVSVGTVHTIIRKELKMRKICAKFVPCAQRRSERRCHDSREMVELISSDPAVLDALVTCDESWIYCYDPETKRQGSQWKHAGSPRPNKARQSKSTTNFWWSLFLTALGWSTCTGFPVDSQQEILCWGFKGDQEEIQSEEASTLQIGSVAFPPGQCTTPSLSQTIWSIWATRQLLTLT